MVSAFYQGRRKFKSHKKKLSIIFLESKDQIKPQNIRKKEITKIRWEVNATETKNVEIIIESKS